MSWMELAQPVRGSSNRGGVDALAYLISEDWAQAHHSLPRLIAPAENGSGELSPSICCPTHKVYARVPGQKRMASGDPERSSDQPFTTIYIITGEPISIPENVSRKELSQYVSAAQEAMDRLNDEAELICSGKTPLPSPAQSKVA